MPLLLAISALSVLALLTQSLSTIDLIIENRQSALTFLYITLLTLPQLLGIILPIAVFVAILYALNRVNVDSELVVSKAAGFSPWQLASPALRVAMYALIAHLIINLFLQPFSQRQMRSAIFDVRTDLASQLIVPGQFNKPAPGLTVFASAILQNGQMSDLLIYDTRGSAGQPTTYTANSGTIRDNGGKASLTMRNGNVQYKESDGNIRVVAFDDYQFDLSEVMSLDSTLNYKASDRYLHELLRVDPNDYNARKFREAYQAEGHSRLATPLYNIALVMIALCFLIRGEFKRMGYGRAIALAALIGFFIRLLGLAMTSAAESDTSLNIFQYGIPLTVIGVCGWYILSKKHNKSIFSRIKHDIEDIQAESQPPKPSSGAEK